MIESHEKFKILDKNGANDFVAEVNWKPKDKAINQCKVVKFIFPDGREAYVERKHLLELVWYIGQPEDQVKLIPQTLKKARWYETVVGVKATKDIRKGEEIIFPIKLTIPEERQEVIGPILKK